VVLPQLVRADAARPMQALPPASGLTAEAAAGG
jgi:hypothetical protein